MTTIRVFRKHLNFFSWLIFTFGALRLGLYIYGDLFVVRLETGKLSRGIQEHHHGLHRAGRRP